MKVYYFNTRRLKHVLNESNDTTTLSSSRSKSSIFFDRIIPYRSLEKYTQIHKNNFPNILNETCSNLCDRSPLKHRANSITSTSLLELNKKIRKDAFGIPINKFNKALYKVSFADKVSTQPLVEIVNYADTQKTALKSIEEMQKDSSICCCSII